MTKFHKTASTFIQRAKTLPGKYYTSDEIFAQECDRIFATRWLCVGREEQIPNPGDYFLQDIGGESLIVLRDSKQEIHAFYNLCRHRGTRLCVEAKGNFTGTINCPYHAWSYGLDGRLIVAPLMNELADFCHEDYPLHQVNVITWEGFIFLNLSQSPEPFTSAFAPLIGKFRQWDLPQLRVADRIDYNVKANWKLIFLNYSECYHCPVIHPNLAKLSPYRSGENDLISGAFLGGFMRLNQPVTSLTMSGNRCGVVLGKLSGEDLNRVYYYSIFPNLLLSLFPDYVMVHRLLPQSKSETQVICEWLFSPESFNQTEFNPDDAVLFWDRVNQQDWQVCELMQAGVGSRAYTPGLYSSAESLLAQFDREFLRVMGH